MGFEKNNHIYLFRSVIHVMRFLRSLFKDFYIFTASYSNNVFPDPLTKEEEEMYIEKANMGDSDARNKLIEHNLRLVAHIVKKYDHRKEDIDDLISIGTIGLIKGVDSYSFKHKTRLTTYCARCIENEILMHFRSDKKNNKNISIDEGVGFDKEGNVITFLDILKTPKPDFALDIHNQDSLNLLKEYFTVLTEREKDIIIKRYGLDGNDEITQKEIAKELGISRSYVSRIEKRALTKILREFIKNNKQ
jgi:RNA polymerase sigma-28 factor